MSKLAHIQAQLKANKEAYLHATGAQARMLEKQRMELREQEMEALDDCPSDESDDDDDCNIMGFGL